MAWKSGAGVRNLPMPTLYEVKAPTQPYRDADESRLAKVDEFIGKLWQTHESVKADKRGYTQDLALGLFRSDYMLHTDPESSNAATPSIKQVEFNTIASSFGGLSSKVSRLHKHLLRSNVYDTTSRSWIKEQNLPQSESVPALAAGMADAHEAYGPPTKSPDVSKCILFIVQSDERNVFDQRALEFELEERHGVKVFRLAFNHVLDHTNVAENGALIYVPPFSPSEEYEVSVVYFRAGYTPDDYPDQRAWDARFQLEISRAIKCPTVLTQLAGTKKVQQVLAVPGSTDLERFVPDTEKRNLIQKTFSPIYPMDQSAAGLKAREIALNPETAKKHVLKPQREGGGNNVYRAKIPSFLQEIGEDKWPAYILMEMIETPPAQNAIFRNGEVQRGGVICELGIYGVCLWRNPKFDSQTSGSNGQGEVVVNREAGYLLRTKGDQSEEGGVAAGFGAVDSVCLHT
jgi:glutathione synthase